MASTSQGPSIAQLINRFRTERPEKRPERDDASSGQVEASEPVTRDVEAPSFPPAAHAPAPDAPPLTALPHSSRLRTMAAAHDQKPAQKPSRVGALLELAESCPPLKEALRSMTLSPAVRDEQSMSTLQQALHASELMISQTPRIAAVSPGLVHEDPWKVHPCESPETASSPNRSNSPTQRFQKLPVHLSGTERVPGRLSTATRSMTSSPESHAALKVPSHHALDGHQSAASPPPLRNDDDQPYHALARDYATSSSAGSFWSPGSSRSQSPAVPFRTVQSSMSQTARRHLLGVAVEQAPQSEPIGAPESLPSSTASVSVTHPITGEAATWKHAHKDPASPRQEVASNDPTDTSECGSSVSFKEVPQRMREEGAAGLHTSLQVLPTYHTPDPKEVADDTVVQPVPAAANQQAGVDPGQADEAQTQDECHSGSSSCNSISVQARDTPGCPAVSCNNTCDNSPTSPHSLRSDAYALSSVCALCGDSTPVVSSPSPVRQESIAASSSDRDRALFASSKADADSPSGGVAPAEREIGAGGESKCSTPDVAPQHWESSTHSAADCTAPVLSTTGNVHCMDPGDETVAGSGEVTESDSDSVSDQQSEPTAKTQLQEGDLSAMPLANQAIRSSSDCPVPQAEQIGASEQIRTQICTGGAEADQREDRTWSECTERVADSREETADEPACGKHGHRDHLPLDCEDTQQHSGIVDVLGPQESSSHDVSAVLKRLSGNRQHTPQVPRKQMPQNSSDDSSPEPQSSPKLRRRQLGRNAKVDESCDHQCENAQQEQGSEDDMQMEGTMRPHNASSTVDEVRSIYWQLDSFMEQYIATQCTAGHTSNGRCDDPKLTNFTTETNNKGLKGVAEDMQDQCLKGVDASNSKSCLLHLSVRSRDARPNKRAGHADSTDVLHGSELAQQGLQAVLQLSTRSAEVSIFDANRDDSYSAIVWDNLGENFARSPQLPPSFHQEVAGQDIGSRHPRGFFVSDESSEASGMNPRQRFRQQPDPNLRGGRPEVNEVAVDKPGVAPASTHSTGRGGALSVPFAVPLHVPTHAPWLEPITGGSRHRESTSHRVASSIGSQL